MAIPSILLAIAIIAITRASVRGVLLAITIPEIPRVVRLVRGVVLTLREQPYVEATRGLGSGVPRDPGAATSCPTRWPRSPSRRPTSARWRS